MAKQITFDFSGKTVLVTGAARNVGYTTAEAFARSGARVVMHGRDRASIEAARERIAAAAPGAELHTVAFDLAKEKRIAAGFAQLEKRGLMPEILVNNGAHLGVGTPGFLEQDLAFFRAVLEVNLFGTLQCSQRAAAHMKAKGGGVIVNVSSVAGEHPIWGRAAYNTSKSALDGLTRTMALELIRDGIRVNEVTPNYIWTTRWNDASTKDVRRRKLNIPFGEPSRQEEVAAAVLFLASDITPSLIGARIVLDGGFSIQQVPRDTAV